jgi:hypothetical protein
MADFYADENFRFPVTVCLRALGHNVLTAQEAGRARTAVSDEEVLADAMASRRILLTQNRRDFKRLHRRGQPHCGIVLCTYDRDAQALAQRISDAIVPGSTAQRWLVSITRPNPSQTSGEFPSGG